MSKGLEALEEVKKYYPFKVNEIEYLNIETIEKELKALEIIKNNLNWYLFLDYSKGCFIEKEYDLLKEVML